MTVARSMPMRLRTGGILKKCPRKQVMELLMMAFKIRSITAELNGHFRGLAADRRP